MATAEILFEVKFDTDVYAAQARGLYSELMLNSGYNGIQTVDIVTGHITQVLPFTNKISDFSIETWLVSPDGANSYLFNRERGGFAICIDHIRNSSHILDLPEDFEAPTGLCWFAPELYMRDYYGRDWVLLNGSVQKVSNKILPEQIRCSLRLDNPDEALGVLRLSHHHRGLYVMNALQIGFISFAHEPNRLMAQNGEVLDVAVWDDGLLACRADNVTIWRNGQQVLFTSASNGESFLRVESFSLAGKVYVLLLSAREDGTGSILRGFVSENLEKLQDSF